MLTHRSIFAGTLLGTLLGTLMSAASAQIGSTYCMANPNSTGSISAITASGSTDAMLNDVTLGCGSLPQHVFGYFITSQTQGFVMNPGGSPGNLCLGGAIGRYAGNILTSGTVGSVSLPIDLTTMPSPTGLYAVMPGDTVNFQFWHRDSSPMGASSNLSEGLEIAFDAVQTGPTFQNDVYPLLLQPNIGGPACVDCHGGTCGLDFSTAQTAFNGLVNVQAACCFPAFYVIPNDPANSLLYQKLTTPSCGMPMPFIGSFAGDPNVIRDWILAGATL